MRRHGLMEVRRFKSTATFYSAKITGKIDGTALRLRLDAGGATGIRLFERAAVANS
jgi:hypothetical protein